MHNNASGNYIILYSPSCLVHEPTKGSLLSSSQAATYTPTASFSTHSGRLHTISLYAKHQAGKLQKTLFFKGFRLSRLGIEHEFNVSLVSVADTLSTPPLIFLRFCVRSFVGSNFLNDFLQLRYYKKGLGDHYVFNRDPPDILETECMCEYCLNENRNGNNTDYRVFPIMVTRYFRMKNWSGIFNAEFSIGCFCELPN